MRVVLDSNVIVAAFASRGICTALFEYCIENHEVVLCAEMLEETERALTRKVGVPRRIVQDVLAYLSDEALLLPPSPVRPGTCREKNDLPVLGVALAGSCEYIVTGDVDLLSLGKHGRAKIVSPRAFWEKMKRGRGV